MKFSGLLALLAIPSAAAFAPAPNGRQSTAVFSSPASVGAGVGAGVPASTTKNVPASAVAQGVAKSFADLDANVIVHGDSLRTWAFSNPTSDSAMVNIRTDGRPLNSNVELWIGPDWTPLNMKIYSEDGMERPIRTMIGTKGVSHTVAIYNEAAMEFPLTATAALAPPPASLSEVSDKITSMMTPKIVEGGAIHTVAFAPQVEQIQVLLKTQGMKLNARIELLNGPNNIKQTFELHTNDGMNRPFYAIFEAPGAGNVIRVVNLATLEFPFRAYILEA